MQEATFETLHREMYPRLVRYACRTTDRDTAEDAAALALQTLWQKSPPEPTDDVQHRQVRSLCYRLVEGHLRNIARSERSRRRTWMVLVQRRRDPERVEDIADLVCDGPLPEWADQLPPTDREVLALVVDGYSVAEISLILECSPAAVSMRLQRARARVAKALEREGHREVGA